MNNWMYTPVRPRPNIFLMGAAVFLNFISKNLNIFLKIILVDKQFKEKENRKNYIFSDFSVSSLIKVKRIVFFLITNCYR